jgi:hypothetical protein
MCRLAGLATRRGTVVAILRSILIADNAEEEEEEEGRKENRADEW